MAYQLYVQKKNRPETRELAGEPVEYKAEAERKIKKWEKVRDEEKLEQSQGLEWGYYEV